MKTAVITATAKIAQRFLLAFIVCLLALNRMRTLYRYQLRFQSSHLLTGWLLRCSEARTKRTCQQPRSPACSRIFSIHAQTSFPASHNFSWSRFTFVGSHKRKNGWDLRLCAIPGGKNRAKALISAMNDFLWRYMTVVGGLPDVNRPQPSFSAKPDFCDGGVAAHG